jgi:A/G-specific adenine glycosylase
MPEGAPLPDVKALARALLAWYAVHQRDLPWRNTSDPYRIWVSEIMLQQTRVAAAIPYYERFLARFPTVQALAEADLSQVLALWQGLGYYTRARSLHRAARMVQAQHGGQLPAERAALLALPGIGAYTAGALLSIAFGQDAIALDGNVKRILARLFDYPGEVNRPAAQPDLERYAEALLPPGQARAFNQALMDLGSLVCLPGAPLCSACPIAAFCLAHQRGVEHLRPVRARRGPIPTVEMRAAYIPRPDGRWLMARRRPQGLLGGLWEFPAFAVAPDDDAPPAHSLAAALRRELGLEAQVGEALFTVAHAYTHLRVRVQVYPCQIAGEPTLLGRDTWDALGWLAQDDLADHGLTGVAVRILERLHGPQLRLL